MLVLLPVFSFFVFPLFSFSLLFLCSNLCAFLNMVQISILNIMCFGIFLWVLCAWGLPRWLSGEEAAYQCGSHRRCRFDPWVGKIPWRRKWQPTPVFLPGKSHGQRSLVSSCPWGHKKSDMTAHTCAACLVLVQQQGYNFTKSTTSIALFSDFSALDSFPSPSEIPMI